MSLGSAPRPMDGNVSAPLDKALAQFFKFSCEM